MVYVACWTALVGDAGLQHEVVGVFSSEQQAWCSLYSFVITWAKQNSFAEKSRNDHAAYEKKHRKNYSKSYETKCREVRELSVSPFYLSFTGPIGTAATKVAIALRGRSLCL